MWPGRHKPQPEPRRVKSSCCCCSSCCVNPKIRSVSNLLRAANKEKLIQLLEPSTFNSSPAAGLYTLHMPAHTYSHVIHRVHTLTHTHTQSEDVTAAVCQPLCVSARPLGQSGALFWRLSGTLPSHLHVCDTKTFHKTEH